MSERRSVTTMMRWGAVAFFVLVIGCFVHRVWTADDPTPAISHTPSSAVPTSSDAPEEPLERDVDAETTTTAEATEPVAPAIDPSVVETHEPTITLHGNVNDATRPGLSARLTDLEITFTQPSNVRRVLLADGKDYVVEGIRPGRVNIRVKDAGYKPLSEDRQIGGSPLDQNINFYLEPLDQMSVRLETSDGTELLAAIQADPVFKHHPLISVVGTSEAPGPSIPYVRGRASASYPTGKLLLRFLVPDNRSDGKYARVCQLPEPKPRFLSACFRGVVLQTKPMPVEKKELVFVIPLDLLH